MLQASNARIMNEGTDQNIMTQLGITSNEYNLVTVLYYVRAKQRSSLCFGSQTDHGVLDPIYCARSTVELVAQKILTFKMAVKDHGKLGHRSHVQCCCEKQRWFVHYAVLAGLGKFYSRCLT